MDISPSSSPHALNISNEQDMLRILRPLKLFQILECYAGQFQIPNAGMIWELMSFPLKPEYYLHADKEKLELLSGGLARALDLVIQKYPDDVRVRVPPSLGAGNYFDLVAMLGGGLIRNNGDQFALLRDSLKGKHVLVCCFHVPYLRPWKCQYFQSLVNLCKELYSKRNDFEMLLVARMNIQAGEKEVFDRFFSGFPGSCIIVPFEIPLVRDSACKVLGLGLKYDHRSGCRCEYLFLNGVGKIVDLGEEVLWYYGDEAFPFTRRFIEQADKELLKVGTGERSLEAILRCDESSPDYVHKFGSPSGERVRISKLSSETSYKHFGLFLCCEGYLIPRLAKIFEQCRAAGHQFDVVVVYIPFVFEKNVDPDIFKREIDGLLQEFDSCQSWWCLPFDNSVSLRFKRFTRYYENNISSTPDVDKLIVVGPGVEELDMYGADVMRRCGIGSFPFTVEAAYRNPVRMLQEIRLDSLLDSGVYRGDDYVPVSDLRGPQMTFIYTGHISSHLETLVPLYHAMKERFHYELVFVEITDESMEYSEVRPGVAAYTWPLHDEDTTYSLVSNEDRVKIKSEMPWYTCSTINQSLSTLMRVVGRSSGLLVGFGDDGRLRSINFVKPPFSLDDFTSVYNIDEFFETLVNDEYDFHFFGR